MDPVFHGVTLTHPEKVLYPEQGIAKRGIAEYYEAVASRMLPHVALRPISLVRCPAGRQKKCFFQRHAGSGVPPQVEEIPIGGFEDSGAYLSIRDAAGLMALTQIGVLEIHPWGSRVDRPDRPDRVIFDLDPGEGLSFSDVVAAARALRRFLNDLGLISFLKTTGGKGLHIVVPVARRYSWSEVKAFAKAAADTMASRAPEHYLTRISKAERRGRIFIDYLRNDPTSTAVAPYSTRARESAPVSMPLDWDQLTARLDPMTFTVKTVPAQIARQKSDPWARIGKLHQKLPDLR